MDEQQLRDFAERYTAAWCSQNPEEVASHFTPDGALQVNAGAPAEGRAAIAVIAQSFMTSFPDLRVILDRLVQAGETMQYHWILEGTHCGPGGTGRRVRISGYEEWELSPDGLIRRSLGHFDEEEYRRQLEGLGRS